MRTVIIHGQNHKGSTYHMGRIFAERIAGEQEITEFFLPRDLNHFCMGCYACISDESKCPYYEEKKSIMDAMEAAEVLVFTTPNYCMGPSASMKAFIDLFFDIWMTHKPREWMFHKKAVVFSTAAGAGIKPVMKMMRTALVNWGVPYIRTYGLSVQAMNWDMVADKKKERIINKLHKMATQVTNKKNPKPGIQVRFWFWLMKGMHASGWDSDPSEKPYWEERGWLTGTKPWA